MADKKSKTKSSKIVQKKNTNTQKQQQKVVVNINNVSTKSKSSSKKKKSSSNSNPISRVQKSQEQMMRITSLSQPWMVQQLPITNNELLNEIKKIQNTVNPPIPVRSTTEAQTNLVNRANEIRNEIRREASPSFSPSPAPPRVGKFAITNNGLERMEPDDQDLAEPHNIPDQDPSEDVVWGRQVSPIPEQQQVLPPSRILPPSRRITPLPQFRESTGSPEVRKSMRIEQQLKAGKQIRLKKDGTTDGRFFNQGRPSKDSEGQSSKSSSSKMTNKVLQFFGGSPAKGNE